jgi:hypothetical protein
VPASDMNSILVHPNDIIMASCLIMYLWLL